VKGTRALEGVDEAGRCPSGGEGLEVSGSNRGVDDVLGGIGGMSGSSEHGDGGEGCDLSLRNHEGSLT
jgi:hypothetical protein